MCSKNRHIAQPICWLRSAICRLHEAHVLSTAKALPCTYRCGRLNISIIRVWGGGGDERLWVGGCVRKTVWHTYKSWPYAAGVRMTTTSEISLLLPCLPIFLAFFLLGFPHRLQFQSLCWPCSLQPKYECRSLKDRVARAWRRFSISHAWYAYVVGDGMLRLRVQITRPANDNLSCTFTINNYFLEWKFPK